MDTYKIALKLTEPMLGTVPKDKDVYATHVQSKAADLGDEAAAQELATIESIEEKGWTGFHKVDGQPVIYDYVVKGFLKAAAGALRRSPETRSSKLTAYKKVINDLVFVFPRQIRLECSGAMGTLERPLRAQTPQGERVALARSDTVPAGTTLSFTVKVLGVVGEAQLREWLEYGELSGLGQWRNASYGRFTYTLEKV